jgi:hypothetical protein
MKGIKNSVYFLALVLFLSVWYTQVFATWKWQTVEKTSWEKSWKATCELARDYYESHFSN